MPPSEPKSSLTEPIAGPHHCIGTTNAVVELTFRYLQASCASHGGILRESDLAAAQTDLLETFSTTLDYFEVIHQRCMCASGVTGQPVFAQGRILSALLFLCGQRTASYCFALQADRVGASWFKLFFDGFAVSLGRHIDAKLEASIGMAYAKVASVLGQKLTIQNLLADDDVKKVLQDCIAPFGTPAGCTALATDINNEVNFHITKNNRSPGPHVSKITDDQMLNFLKLFPREVGIVLK